MTHTIVLIQPGKPETRTYADYETTNEAMEGICHLFEEYLKKQDPTSPSITYDINQLFDYLDSMTDISCLVFQIPTSSYAPYSRDWIKEKIYGILRQQIS